MAEKKNYINYSDFIQQLDKGIIEPLYLFQGEESFLIEESIERMKQMLIQPGLADFNYDKFSSPDLASIGDVLDQAQTIPFLSKWRLIILTDVDESDTTTQNQMIAYLSNPNQTTCLIMTARKLDNRTKFAQALHRHATVVQFWKLFENEVSWWVSRRAKRYGYTIALPTANYLFELVGNDLRQLDNELKKIIAYSNDKEMSADVIQQVVGDIRERDIFELVDAVGAGNAIDALRILNQLLIEGEEPLKILMMVVRQFRLLWKVKASLVEKKSLSTKQLAGLLGIPYRSADQLQKQVQRFSQVQLKQGMKRLCKVDRALKSSTNPPKILLEDVFIDLCLP